MRHFTAKSGVALGAALFTVGIGPTRGAFCQPPTVRAEGTPASASAANALPRITSLYTIAPNVLAVVIEAGKITPSTLRPYVFQAG